MLVELESKNSQGIHEAGQRIVDEVLSIASGTQTKAEILGYGMFPGLCTQGPII